MFFAKARFVEKKLPAYNHRSHSCIPPGDIAAGDVGDAAVVVAAAAPSGARWGRQGWQQSC